jgi:D-amino-acid dehydrogenase
LGQAQALHLLRENGWLWLYQNPSSFEASAFTRQVLEEFSVATEILSPQSLHDLEPHLAPHYAQALWIKDAASVANPESVVKAYAQQFLKAGGIFKKEEIKTISKQANGWQWHSANGISHRTPNLVVAMGPWSEKLLARFDDQNQGNIPIQKTSNINLKMGFERGYHRQFEIIEGLSLSRPIYDISGAYVLSPMKNTEGKNVLRLTTGIELAAQDAQPNWQQLEDAENAARRAYPMKEALPSSDWLGARPSLPDSRPVIGEMPGLQGLWFAFGHQHIGFSTGPGTGVLLAELMSSESTSIDPQPFGVERS